MHLQCQFHAALIVTDALQWAYDPRLDGFAPSHLAGKPEEIQKWAVEEMKITAHGAKAMGVGQPANLFQGKVSPLNGK